MIDPTRTILTAIGSTAILAAIMLLGFVADGAIKRQNLDRQESFSRIAGIVHAAAEAGR